MGDFATEDDLKRFLRDEITYDIGLFTDAIAAAERYIRDECQRDIRIADTSATARTYRPDSPISRVLWIHDCTEITSVVENGTTLTVNTDYVVGEHQVSWSGESRPISRLERYGTHWYADGTKRTITVTAKWGWAAIPTGAKQACIVAAKAYIDARDVQSGLAGLSQMGGVSEREAKMVRDFISNYRGHASWGIA